MTKEEVTDVEVVDEIELARESFIVKPINVESTLQAYKEFERIKKELLNDNDFLHFGSSGKAVYDGSGTPYIKKSGWRKCKTAFGISIEFLNDGIRSEQEDGEGRYYVWSYKVRASAPNGIFQDAVGASTSRNPFFSVRFIDNKRTRIDPQENDIMLTAQTVAINRAVSDLVGGGEVSAEEMLQSSGSNGALNASTNYRGSSGTAYKNTSPQQKAFDWSKLDLSKTASEKMRNRLFAIRKRLDITDGEFKLATTNLTKKEHSKEWTYGDVKAIDEWLIDYENQPEGLSPEEQAEADKI